MTPTSRPGPRTGAALRAIGSAVVLLTACTAPQRTPPATPPEPVPVVALPAPGYFSVGPAAAAPGPAAADFSIGPIAVVGGEPGPGLVVGAAATDGVGGLLPEGRTLTLDDVGDPIIGRLDPDLRAALADAARGAAADGVALRFTSGWRTRGFQLRLFDDGVRTYGSVEAARQYVATPEVSRHVTGEAVDVLSPDAAQWMVRNGSRYGLCQMYANEIWHYELTADAAGNCPPMKATAAS
ncbi:M15 family metallopeptidase [Mycobacterium sp. MYCO198283]|uniref:M15 family metallopeptidase n=1 Tax=Mycobacterium sp. MYCO198283 TaxID=2883505 RepID=UPI001E3235DF|nr:M15 family metallopeptidase [Mycobacterium sp. MYCO198283]MCG5434015.1 M15 family metallopeptidase [Mycobacterium sp. MYCO198283]